MNDNSTLADAPPQTCELTLRIAGMSCAACQTHVQRALDAVPGVQDATVDLLGRTARVTSSIPVDAGQLTAAVRRAGYDVIATPTATYPDSPSSTSNAAQTTHDAEPGERTLGLRALLSLLAGGLAMLLSMPLMHGAHPDALSQWWMTHTPRLFMAPLAAVSPNHLRWMLFCLALVTMLFAAPEIYRAAWRAARHRATNMNTLVALGTLVAFTASTYTTSTLSFGRPGQNFTEIYFEAVIFILAFLLTGRWLEAQARNRATSSLRAFARSETGQARWIGEGVPPELERDPKLLLQVPETLLPLDAVAVGDLLRVLPGDRVPLDGIVLAGRSSVDESMLTGEPLPVSRAAGDKLLAGTVNLDGPLLLRATALGADSMQAQMARLLERARSTRAPLQRLADRVSAVFVPSVLGMAALTFLAWAALDNTAGHHLGLGRALSLAIAVLVVACPCAMGLAVPAAVAVSLGTAARRGILIKGGEALERLAAVDTVAFDKTGTLTEGRPEIVAFHLAPGSPYSRAQLLCWAVAVEAASPHPLAEAVRRYADTLSSGSRATPEQARVLPGLGAEATLDGHTVTLGNATLLRQRGALPAPPELTAGPSHATPIFLLVDDRLEAALLATDMARPSARAALVTLGRLHLRTILLTGDTEASARALAASLGLTDIQASLLPADKLTAISALQTRNHRVAMVGDGLNDAAALARADAGIAMASGTDLAREAGHVLLLQHDLRLVPEAIALARRTRRLMRQNLAWALAYNVVALPVAAGLLLPHFGLQLTPALASAAMALSSVSVLLNSLRLARAPALPANSASLAPAEAQP